MLVRGEVRRCAAAEEESRWRPLRTIFRSSGSYYCLLPPSPVRHAYEPVPCIISFPWSMHVCHLNITPQHTHNIHAPNHRTCKKHRLETTRLADSSSRSAPLHFLKKKKHVRLIPTIIETNLLAEFHLRRFTLGEPSSDYLQCSIFINEKTNEICRDLTNATRRVFRSVFSTWVHSFKPHTFTRDR